MRRFARLDVGLRRGRTADDDADDGRLIFVRSFFDALIEHDGGEDEREQDVHHRPMIRTWNRSHFVFERNSSSRRTICPRSSRSTSSGFSPAIFT